MNVRLDYTLPSDASYHPVPVIHNASGTYSMGVNSDGSINAVVTSGLISIDSGANTIGNVKVTDGTNFMPTMDVVGRAGYTYVTDGTNTMPTMDTAARAGNQNIYGYNGTNWHPPRIDAQTRAWNTIDYAHHEIHAGSHYYVAGSMAALPTATNLDFLWVVPDNTKWPHALWSLESNVELTMSMYESVTTSADGNAATVFNNNRNSLNSNIVGGFMSAALNSGALGDGSDGGILVWQAKVGAGKKIGGAAGRNHEFIGKQNSKYWFRINNGSGGTGWVNYDFNWYEHTDEAA